MHVQNNNYKKTDVKHMLKCIKYLSNRQLYFVNTTKNITWSITSSFQDFLLQI